MGKQADEKTAWQQTATDRPSVNSLPRSKDPDKQAQIDATAFHDHPKNAAGRLICGAKLGNGGRCQVGAGKDTGHIGFGKCGRHGGNTPTLRTSAAKFIGGEVIDRMSMGGYGRPVEISPTDALLQEVSRAAGHVAWLAQRIDSWELKDGELMTAYQHETLDLYHAERKQVVWVSKIALDAGVDERKIRLKEAEAGNIVALLKHVFTGLQLSVAQQRLVQTIVPAALREYAEPVRYAESERVEIEAPVDRA